MRAVLFRVPSNVDYSRANGGEFLISLSLKVTFRMLQILYPVNFSMSVESTA